MNDKINWKAFSVGCIVVIVGIICVILDLYLFLTASKVWISIGCSFIASGSVIILTCLLIERVYENPLEHWGIKRIYQTRATMNEDCDMDIKKARHQIDVIAFGIKSYRNSQNKITKDLLNKGVNFRIITMDPDSEFISQREKEEGEVPGQIKKTILDLIEWADSLNKKSKKGKISIKGYSCMTLDFYWRVDDCIYLGPYWYGIGSQQTVSYKYSRGTGFDMYTDYFEKLWNDNVLMKDLVST